MSTKQAIAVPVATNISLGKFKFSHAWSGGETIKTEEYVEEGQTLKNWQHLLAYRIYLGQTDPARIVSGYLKQIKPTQKPVIYQKGSDLMLVFLIEAPDSSYTEFDIHRFTLEDGVVRSYQFAARNYERPLYELTDELKAYKGQWTEMVGKLTAKIIEVDINDITYKRIENLDGPNYIVSKADLLVIKYSNGQIDSIKNFNLKIREY